MKEQRRAWHVALVGFFSLALAGTVALFFDRVALGFGLLIAAGFVTIAWNEWKRRRGLG